VVALTATARPRVLEDVKEIYGLSQAKAVIDMHIRPNLNLYSVDKPYDQLLAQKQLKEVLNKNKRWYV
jgi:superfamily II DNA helicase RecQ